MFEHEVDVVELSHGGHVGIDELDHMRVIHLPGNADLAGNLTNGVQVRVGTREEANDALDRHLDVC